jgi:hypothetical protein
MAAPWAAETIAALHFSLPVKQAPIVAVLEQTAELLDSRRPPHEDLHSAGIANQIRFVFLREPNFPCLHTYGTREHLFAVDRYHRTAPNFADFGGDATIMHASADACRGKSEVFFKGSGRSDFLLAT